MTNIQSNIGLIDQEIGSDALLVAVSKTKPNEDILDAYQGGQRHFGENKVQELEQKHLELPKDIKWHMIGHLQTNKVKFIAPFVSLIHSVDSLKLAKEINKQALKNNRTIDVLLQVHVGNEESKFGLSKVKLNELLSNPDFTDLTNIKVTGLMTMATNTESEDLIKKEFKEVHTLYTHLKSQYDLNFLSMGMSSDYKLAIQSGSNMIRVGSTIFGQRNYTT